MQYIGFSSQGSRSVRNETTPLQQCTDDTACRKLPNSFKPFENVEHMVTHVALSNLAGIFRHHRSTHHNSYSHIMG